MRNSDNLHDSTSSFYAELKRIRKVINLVKAESNVFYLLDEILKGTNSKDRHKGSRALILQLIRDRGAGIVATHDLDLGNMQDEHPALIENICLEVDIKGNELDFDYKIQKGVCKSLNASILMQNMGIDL
jgi:DNA mismatch repair ATPase MutS